MRVASAVFFVPFLLLSLLGLLSFSASAAPAGIHPNQAVRPLVIIIPGNQESVSGVSSTQEAIGETLSMRSMRAAGKVRDYLNDSNVVEATLYSPEAPLFIRAALEAKLKIARRMTLTNDEQVSLAKAAGAIYVAVVSVQQAVDSKSNFDMLLQGIEVGSRKNYSDKSKYQIRSDNQPADTNAIRVESTTSPNNAINSAANTLVARLLNGPLAAYGRVAPPPVLVDPKPAPEPLVNIEGDMVAATVQQANALLADGNTTGAIVLLRRTINQAPLSLKLRMLLARMYLGARRNSEASSEIKRAFLLITPTETERKEAFQLLSEAFQQSGNKAAAQRIYEDVIATQPRAIWARLALADLLAEQKPEVAVTQYQAVLQIEPGNPEAIKGLVHLLGKRGDFDVALSAIAPVGEDTSAKKARWIAATALFDEFSADIIVALQQNRRAWDAKQMTREAFYKATASQVTQANALVRMLKSAPPLDTDTSAKKPYSHRLLGASLLAQSATALQTFLETGDRETGAQSNLWLAECQKELKGSQDGG